MVKENDAIAIIIILFVVVLLVAGYFIYAFTKRLGPLNGGGDEEVR